MYIGNDGHLINMESFILKMYGTILAVKDWYKKILEKVLFWCQKWIFNNLGEF
jgi:hypothetical protein